VLRLPKLREGTLHLDTAWPSPSPATTIEVPLLAREQITFAPKFESQLRELVAK
jgi:hypothetical protein